MGVKFSKYLKNKTVVVLFLIILSTTLRLYYALSRNLYPSGPDGPWYIRIMEDFAKFGFFSSEISFLPFYPSGYAITLSVFPKYFGDHWVYFAQTFQVVLLGLALFFWYKFVSRVMGESTGLIVILFFSLSPSWIVFPGSAMYESFLISILIFYYWYFLTLLNSSALCSRKLLIIGLFAGFIISVHPRTTPLVLLPALILYQLEWKKSLKFSNLIYFLALIPFFPSLFAYRNYVGTKQFTIFSASNSSYKAGHDPKLASDTLLESIKLILEYPVIFLVDSLENAAYFLSPFSGPAARGLWFHNISVYRYLDLRGFTDYATLVSILISLILVLLFLSSTIYLIRKNSKYISFFVSGALILFLTDVLVYGDNRHRLVCHLFSFVVVAKGLTAIRSSVAIRIRTRGERL